MKIANAFAYPFRRGAVNFERGSFLRSASIWFLKRLGNNRLPSNILEIRPVDRPDISFAVCDSMVAEEIYWYGIQGYEGILSDVWIKLCTQKSSILEIGGNIGIYAVIGGLAAGGRYVVVEPVPEVVALLKENLSRNLLSDKVVLIEAAAIPGNESHSVILNIPAEGRGAPVGAHLSTAMEIDARTTERLINVCGEPLSVLIDGCDLIKIDAEGIEELLLKSVRSYLIKKKPTLVIEVLPEAKNLAIFIAELAEETNMKIFVIPGYGTQPITEILAKDFTSNTPKLFKSKDVVISMESIL